jgi:thiamine kinase-like enzyme
MDTYWTTDLMRETLQDGLTRRHRRLVHVQKLHRETHPTTTSFWTERLVARLDSGEELPVFFKDLNPESLIAAARGKHATGPAPGHRELRMYRRIFSRERLGTPQMYAFRWQPSRGLMGLFLEYAGLLKVRHSKDFSHWLAAARWAASFHSRAGALPARRTRFLPRYDRAHYRRCAERIEPRLVQLAVEDRRRVEQALELYADAIEPLLALPQSVIHGEYYGKNVVLRDGSPEEMIAVVDWESAAIGPSYLDVVSLSTGRWTTEKQEALWRIYFDCYRAETGQPIDWEDFCRDLAPLQLYQALAWIGWWLEREEVAQMARWLKELQKIVPGYSERLNSGPFQSDANAPAGPVLAGTSDV